MRNLLARIPLALRQQAKAFLGGAVAAVVAAEAPLVQGGSWSLTTLYAAALSAVVAYVAVYFTTNAPAELTVLERLLASMVGQVAQPTGAHAAVVVAALALPTPVAAPSVPAPAVDFSGIPPVSLGSAAPTVPALATPEVVTPAVS